MRTPGLDPLCRHPPHPRPSLLAAPSPAFSAAARRPPAPPVPTRSARLAASLARSLAGLWPPPALPVTGGRAHESRAAGRRWHAARRRPGARRAMTAVGRFPPLLALLRRGAVAALAARVVGGCCRGWRLRRWRRGHATPPWLGGPSRCRLPAASLFPSSFPYGCVDPPVAAASGAVAAATAAAVPATCAG